MGTTDSGNHTEIPIREHEPYGRTNPTTSEATATYTQSVSGSQPRATLRHGQLSRSAPCDWWIS